MGSVETLRRAAALMRERAEAAADGRWAVEVAQSNGIPNMVITADTAMVVADTYDKPHQHDAEHIASWHPAVALAVADWLNIAAADLVAYANDETQPFDPTAINKALVVARAYLGESA